jgi:hypothetical protein
LPAAAETGAVGAAGRGVAAIVTRRALADGRTAGLETATGVACFKAALSARPAARSSWGGVRSSTAVVEPAVADPIELEIATVEASEVATTTGGCEPTAPTPSTKITLPPAVCRKARPKL